MNSAPSRRLPNRRPHLLFGFEHGGFAYTAGIGFFDDAGQQPAEIFLTTSKHGTVLERNARDAAIAASLLLQHGCPLETLRRALTRNADGSASGPLAHVLDLLGQHQQNQRGGHRMSQLDENEPITLAEACEIFPRAKLTISTLRAEADRGHLDIFRLGKRDYTTVRSMREMVIKCQDESRRRGSTSTRNAANGSSETAQVSYARAALNQTVTGLKAGLPRISGKSTRRNADQTH